ncbi:MAG: transketolase [Acidobacteria bacterium]|nr:transketolase [Acidobacteriota bacterium]
MPVTDRDQLCVNTIRTLSMDAVQRANSGHPGTPMAMAPVAYALWQRHLRFDPNDPIWPDRDRFVLSMGHASMLLYSMLHLCGVKAVNPKYETLGELSVTLDDIKRFRQLDSKCPGHPEYRWTSGIETTTGPLGQGVATSVGMAIAGKWLAASFNRPDFPMFGYRVYALAGDGCMMEGISGEAASMAGHLALDNLCWIYDNNKITIEGHTDLAFSEDVATRFIGYGWNVTRVGDANDLAMLDRAFETAEKTPGRPTLIIVDSHIGYGSPTKQDSHAAHGEPLGADEIRATKRFYGWPEDAEFLVPDGVREHFAEGIGARGARLRADWSARFDNYKKKFAKDADALDRMQRRLMPDGWDKNLPTFPPDPKGMGGRDASAKVLNAIAPGIPWLIGGSADLAPSTKTRLTFPEAGDFEAGSYSGRNFHFGIREHAMGAVLNGLSLSKIRPYGSGFLIFSDYGRAPIRLAAIMEIPVIYVFTHDSIGVGEDGPTHQPVEHLLSLRAIPGLITIRPGDANEVAEAWRVILELRHEPTLFDDQPQDYRDSVLPPSVTARVSVEQASAIGWERYVGSAGKVIGMRTFGASAPLKELQQKFGFHQENVVAAAKSVLGGNVVRQ